MDLHIIPVGADDLLETVTAEIELDTHNEPKKEEKKATEISVPKTCTEPEPNKRIDNQAGSIIVSQDKNDVGDLNIVSDEADKLEPKATANSGDTNWNFAELGKIETKYQLLY